MRSSGSLPAAVVVAVVVASALVNCLAASGRAASPGPTVGALAGVSVRASFVDLGGHWNCEQGSETVQLFSNASGGTPPYAYAWSFGDGTAGSIAANPMHTYNSLGPFQANVTVSDHAGLTVNDTVSVAWVVPLVCSTQGPLVPAGAIVYAGLVAAIGVGAYLLVRWHRGRAG